MEQENLSCAKYIFIIRCAIHQDHLWILNRQEKNLYIPSNNLQLFYIIKSKIIDIFQ